MKTQNSFEDVIKSSSAQKNILFDFRQTWKAYLVLIVLVIASFFAKDFMKGRADSEAKNEFEKINSSVITRLNNQYDRILQVAKSTQGLYYEHIQVVRDYFELTGSVPVKNFSSIMCMTYAPKVLQADWEIFQYNALSQGYVSYDLNPAGTRDYYYPVEHIVVYEQAKQRLAFDYATVPVMKSAIELAQSENEIVSTEFFNLRTDTLSFALIAPVYVNGSDFNSPTGRTNNFQGSVVIEINANKYFENALTGSDAEIEKGAFHSDSMIVFTVVDKNSQGENIVFKSKNYSAFEGQNSTPLLEDSITINIANRDLIVKFATVPGFGGAVQSQPLMVFIGSLLISVIAFILILVLLTQKARAEEIADKMTASQRRILDTSRDIIAVVSNDGIWLSMNPTSTVLLQTEPSKVVGTKITDYFYDEKDISIWNGILASKEENQRVDIKAKSSNETGFIWISWSFTKSPSETNIIYAIGRDITLEKEAAEEVRFRAKQIDLAHSYEKEASATKVNLMVQLSHEMRNQLTSIMGYLQLIINKVYDSEEELMSYAASANESSETAFAFINDATEATIGDIDTASKMAISTIGDTVNPVLVEYKKAKNSELNIKFAEKSKEAHIIIDDSIISEVWKNLFKIFTTENAQNQITVSATENSMEGVTELIIEAASFAKLNQLIEIYNIAPKDIIDRLREDYDDILLYLGKTASLISIMSGAFSIELMDNNKTAYIFITLPISHSIRG